MANKLTEFDIQIIALKMEINSLKAKGFLDKGQFSHLKKLQRELKKAEQWQEFARQ